MGRIAMVHHMLKDRSVTLSVVLIIPTLGLTAIGTAMAKALVLQLPQVHQLRYQLLHLSFFLE
jgi:hypothetical protein